MSEKQEKELKELYKETFRGGEVKLKKSLYSANEPLAEKAVGILDQIALVGWTSGGLLLALFLSSLLVQELSCFRENWIIPIFPARLQKRPDIMQNKLTIIDFGRSSIQHLLY